MILQGVSENDDPELVSGNLTDSTIKLTSAIRYVCMYVCVGNESIGAGMCLWEWEYVQRLGVCVQDWVFN